jgi:hypothetical protein
VDYIRAEVSVLHALYDDATARLAPLLLSVPLMHRPEVSLKTTANNLGVTGCSIEIET